MDEMNNQNPMPADDSVVQPNADTEEQVEETTGEMPAGEEEQTSTEETPASQPEGSEGSAV